MRWPIVVAVMFAVGAPVGAQASAPNPASLKKVAAAKHGMVFAQGNHALNKSEKLTVYMLGVPIKLADLVVLALGVIVSLLSVADFVAGKQHGHSLRQEKGCDEIPLLP